MCHTRCGKRPSTSPAVRTRVGLTSYPELAVRLVNPATCAGDEPDLLGDPEAFRDFVADRPHLAGQVTRYDLDALRLLRTEFSRIFTAAAEGAGNSAVERMNALLVQHPIHPVSVSHDPETWHLHPWETGSVQYRLSALATSS